METFFDQLLPFTEHRTRPMSLKTRFAMSNPIVLDRSCADWNRDWGFRSGLDL